MAFQFGSQFVMIHSCYRVEQHAAKSYLGVHFWEAEFLESSIVRQMVPFTIGNKFVTKSVKINLPCSNICNQYTLIFLLICISILLLLINLL